MPAQKTRPWLRGELAIPPRLHAITKRTTTTGTTTTTLTSQEDEEPETSSMVNFETQSTTNTGPHACDQSMR